MATVTLSYQVLLGVQNAAAMLARVAAVVLNTGELDLLGMSIVSDTTTLIVDPTCDDAPVVDRTVVLETNAQGDELFPNEDALQDATRQLWRSRLNVLVPGSVTALEPVVS